MAAVASQNILRISRQQHGSVVYLYNIQRRDVHDGVVKKQYNNLAAYRRGKGGRSSFSGIVATVFGAGGNLGQGIVNRLGRTGSQVVCPYRGTAMSVRPLKLMGDLGQILFVPFELKDDETVRRAMKYSNLVVNCIGNFHPTRNYSFEDVNVDGAHRIARLAKECGVDRLIHISDLNATLEPVGIVKSAGSSYLESKQKGEDLVREAFPEATIIRPSVIFGVADRLIWYYALVKRTMFQYHTPLYNAGKSTLKAPVFRTDVLNGISTIIKDPSTAGQTYEFFGPRMYTLHDLVDYLHRTSRTDALVTHFEYNLPYQCRIKWYDYLNKKFSFQNLLTTEVIEWDHTSDTITGLPTLEDLGVKLTPFELIATKEIQPERRTRYKEDIQMERVPEFPPTVYKHLAKNEIRPDPI